MRAAGMRGRKERFAATIATGGEEKKREGKVRSAKKKVESTNGTGSWESGVRDRENIFWNLGFRF